MNLFNRVVVVLLLLALSITSIVTAILPEQIIRLIQETFAPLVITSFDRIVLIVTAAVVTIVALVLIYLEIKPAQLRGVRLTQVKGGKAELSTESIAGRIKQVTEVLPDVQRATPSVVSRGASVDVHVGIVATPGIDVSHKASEVVQVVRNLVETDMRIKLGKLKVSIKYELPAPQAKK
ncbi:MAG: alkaline shock response membrane anchor protein AmaP [Chloroflexi bacterium]|nr:alkaline shock response membrane anchor protein AmaP [Chloroflexota bacterium]